MIDYRAPLIGEEQALAELRARAMRPSLEALGRYDEQRVRARLLDHYQASDTVVAEVEGQVVGFYVCQTTATEVHLAHLYVEPSAQGRGYGSQILRRIQAEAQGRPIRLNALRDSRSNHFYERHGFVRERSEEWDHYYGWIRK